MADPIVEFVTDWIEGNITPELITDEVDEAAVQEHLSALIAEAQDEGISEEDIEESGLDVPSLITSALQGSVGDTEDADD